ncbi:head-tail adaptor protein [Alphaproteobacteria bacterium]|nr:head-tail adaptor protein [Alphaproteobacteria bacterium]
MTRLSHLDKMTELVFLDQSFRVPDGLGGMVLEWRPLEPVWARIEAQTPSRATEQWQGDRPHFSARYWVWLRLELQLPDTYRLRWGETVLVPLSAVTHLSGRDWQKILMEQESL